MSVRRLIGEVDLAQLNVAEFCRLHGIGRTSFYEIRKRVEAEGEAGFEVRSRAPHVVANRTPHEVEDRVVEVRKWLADEGLDNGAGTIRWHLVEQGWGQVPSEATIWRILSRRGFVTPDPKKSRRSDRRFEADRANEMWQIDGTDYVLADGTSVKIINVIDDGSRVLVSSRAHQSESRQGAFDALCIAAQQWGWPQIVLSDNGRGFVSLLKTLAVLGVRKIESRPNHPQTCGKVERFHQTQQKWLAIRPRAETLTDLQHVLDAFTTIYNTERPHRSIGRQRPADRWAAMAKSGPEDRPINVDTTSIVQRRVASNGMVSANNKLISITSEFAGETVTVITTGQQCHIFHDGNLVRGLTINPNKRGQPIHTRPGAPKKTT